MLKHFIVTLCLMWSIFCLGQAEDCSCCTPAHTEFDFWVGSWEVVNSDGSPAGTNTITKIQDNCAILEHWTSASPGVTGMSINFFNSKTEQWEQIWVDNQGETLHLKGNRIGNQMILESDKIADGKGQFLMQRITWIINTDGTVRQLWETVDQKGKTTIAFDGLYKKL